MYLVRVPASSPNFRAAAFSLVVSTCGCFIKPAIERAVGDIGRFEALRTVIAAGAVLTAPHHGWMKGAFNEHAVCCSGSGGTDICGTCVYLSFPKSLCVTWTSSRGSHPFASCLRGRDAG
jgi:hypothetical protein